MAATTSPPYQQLVPVQEYRGHGLAWTVSGVMDRLPARDQPSPLQERLNPVPTTKLILLCDIGLSPQHHPSGAPSLHQDAHAITSAATNQGENAVGYPLC